MTRLLDRLLGDAEAEAFFSDAADLAAMLQFESNLALAEAKAEIVPQEAAWHIADVCQNFQPDWPRLTTALAEDGVVVPELVKQLRQSAGEPHARYVHLGATSQDVIDTSLMVRLKSVLKLAAGRLDVLIDVLHNLKRQYGALPLMAHTRMQLALPFTVSDKLTTWIAPLKRIRINYDRLAGELLVIQLGGPVGTRAEFKDKGDQIAAVLAKNLGLSNAPCWHSQRDRIGELASWLTLLSGSLGKIGQDVALLAQNEIGAIKLALGGGSSAMPHKSNPVLAEILVTLARFNAGVLGTLNQSLVHENERSGAAWTLEWLVLPQMCVATAAALRHALALLQSLEFAGGTSKV